MDFVTISQVLPRILRHLACRAEGSDAAVGQAERPVRTAAPTEGAGEGGDEPREGDGHRSGGGSLRVEELVDLVATDTEFHG